MDFKYGNRDVRILPYKFKSQIIRFDGLREHKVHNRLMIVPDLGKQVSRLIKYSDVRNTERDLIFRMTVLDSFHRMVIVGVQEESHG